MIIDFILVCLKFIGILFAVNFCLGTVFTLIESFLIIKKIQLFKSNFYGLLVIVLFVSSIILSALIYTHLTIMVATLKNTEVLSRTQLLLLLIPILLGISLMSSIANYSDRNFEFNYSQGKVKNFVSGYINSGLLILIVLEIISLIVPSFTKVLLIFYNYILK